MQPTPTRHPGILMADFGMAMPYFAEIVEFNADTGVIRSQLQTNESEHQL